MNREKILRETASFHEHLIKALRNPQEAKAYLQVALEEYQQDGDTEFFLTALRDIAEAKGGMGPLAKQTKLNRQSLYQILSGKGNPTLNTLNVILKSLGFRLAVEVIESS